jgi:intracellular multiplication protein IcmW
MPDLSHQASIEYWSQFFDPSIYRIICFLESVETQTLDGDKALEDAIVNLGNSLDNQQFKFIDINQLKHEEIFIQLIASIKTSRGLRLLQALDQVHSGCAYKIISYAENVAPLNPESPSAIFFKRNLAFERLRLLSRIFSNQRLRIISKALEGEE